MRRTHAPCPLRPERGRPFAAARHAAVHALIPLVRAAVRYPVSRRLSLALWWHLAGPFFAWHAHDFVARVKSGARLAGNTYDVLQQHVYYFGEWEPALTPWVRESLAPGDVFVDLGANVGYFTLLAAPVVGRSGCVIAVEPAPPIFRQLTENVRLNGFENVRCVEAAAGGTDERVSLFGGTESNEGLATVLEELRAGPGTDVVRGSRLDSIVTPEEMERTRLIKIDVEGAEEAILAGMEGLWELARDDLELVVEVHETARPVQDLVDALEARGFHPYRLDIDDSPEAYLATRSRRRPRRLDAPVTENAHLVFSRRDRESL